MKQPTHDTWRGVYGWYKQTKVIMEDAVDAVKKFGDKADEVQHQFLQLFSKDGALVQCNPPPCITCLCLSPTTCPHLLPLLPTGPRR